MSEFRDTQLQEVIRRHRPDADGPIAVERIRTGKFNTSYFVHAGEEDLVLRIAPAADEVFLFYERAMMRQEPQIHQILRERTSVPVAQIVAFDDSADLIPNDYMLMERLPGQPLTDMLHVDGDSVLRQMGEYLGEAHGLHAEEYGYLGAHQPMQPEASWVDAFHAMWGKLIADIVDVGEYDQTEASVMLELLDRYLSLFDRPVAASLLHMDVWHQNILVDDTGQVTGVVDWDRGLWGDPEIEFAVLDYCGISEPAFWEGYGHQRDESPEARVRQRFYLLYEVQKYIVIRAGRNRDRPGAQQYKAQSFALARDLQTA